MRHRVIDRNAPPRHPHQGTHPSNPSVGNGWNGSQGNRMLEASRDCIISSAAVTSLVEPSQCGDAGGFDRNALLPALGSPLYCGKSTGEGNQGNQGNHNEIQHPFNRAHGCTVQVEQTGYYGVNLVCQKTRLQSAHVPLNQRITLPTSNQA